MHNLVESLKKTLTTSINNIDREIKKRSRKISFKDVIYYSSLMIGNNQSYENVNVSLKIHKIINVTSVSLIKYKNKIDCSYFNNINDILLDHVYGNYNDKRLIAVDGTHIALNKTLHEYNYKLSRNSHYFSVLISTLFDVILEMPINYYLSKTHCERSALREQFRYLNKTDILIMDKGYYSTEILFELYNLGIDVIFRLRYNLIILKKLNKVNDTTIIRKYNNQCIKFRILRYTINKKDYYIGTTIYDENIEYFKETYWKRWKIEVNFKYSKYNLSMNNIKSKSENNVIQDIYIHNFIFIISAYIKYNLEIEIKESYSINVTSLLNMIINDLLYLILYKNNTINNTNEIIRIFNIMKESLVYVRPNRHYKRIRYKPSTKWNIHGNRYAGDANYN